MPSLDWNRRWAKKLASFVPGGVEGSHYGDRWGDPLNVPELRAVRARFVDPFVGADVTALEIGSGGGRWTQFLLPCRRIYCVELNREMFTYLAARFAEARHLVFTPSSGTDIPGVPAGSIDFAFSFGTLVHLEVDLIEAYLRSLAPLMRVGGQACLHVANTRKPAGRAKDGFADNDPERMAALLARTGFSVRDLDDGTLATATVVRAERM